METGKEMGEGEGRRPWRRGIKVGNEIEARASVQSMGVGAVPIWPMYSSCSKLAANGTWFTTPGCCMSGTESFGQDSM